MISFQTVLWVALLSSFSTAVDGFTARSPSTGIQPNKPRKRPFALLQSTTTMTPLEPTDNSHLSLNVEEPDMKAYASAYQTLYQEVPFTVCTVSTGTLPSDLKGTYYRNGPVMFTAGSLPPPKTSIVQPKQPVVPDGQDTARMVLHPFDADGAVLAITFHGEEEDSISQPNVTARFRYVRTVGFTNERRKGQRLYTGMDSTRRLSSSSSSSKTQSSPSHHDDTLLANDFPLPLYRHHLLPGLNKQRKNTSNTSVFYWAKKLITLWEGGLPYRLDAVSCSTTGRSQLGGVLKNENIPMGGRYKYDSNTHRMILYSNVLPTTTTPLDSLFLKQTGVGGIGTSSSIITFYEFDDTFRCVNTQQSSLTSQNFGLISDIGVTQDWYVLIEPPMGVKNKVSFAVNKDPGSSLMTKESASAYMHLIPREPNKGGEKVSFALSNDGISDANVQMINSYQVEGSGGSPLVIVDMIRSDARHVKTTSSQPWPWADTIEKYSSSTSKKSLWRYTIQRNALGLPTIQRECLYDSNISFGVINSRFSGKRHSFVYANVGRMGPMNPSPPQGIIKIDCNLKKVVGVWMPSINEFCGEPMYAPRTMKDRDQSSNNFNADLEDDGYILSILYNGNAKKSEMVVLDAKNISAGPISRIPLGFTVPHGLFGTFVSSEEASWSPDEIERRAKLADKVESRGNLWNEVKSDFSGLGLRLDDFEEYFGDVL